MRRFIVIAKSLFLPLLSLTFSPRGGERGYKEEIFGKRDKGGAEGAGKRSGRVKPRPLLLVWYDGAPGAP
jgi:hypothetical protein